MDTKKQGGDSCGYNSVVLNWISWLAWRWNLNVDLHLRTLHYASSFLFAAVFQKSSYINSGSFQNRLLEFISCGYYESAYCLFDKSRVDYFNWNGYGWTLKLSTNPQRGVGVLIPGVCWTVAISAHRPYLMIENCFSAWKKKKNNLLTIVEAALPYRFYSALADIPKTHHAIYSGEGRKALKELLINYRAVYA